MNNGYNNGYNNGFNNQNDGMYNPNNGQQPNMGGYNPQGGYGQMNNDVNQNGYGQMNNGVNNQGMYGANYQNNWAQPQPNNMYYQNNGGYNGGYNDNGQRPLNKKKVIIAIIILVVIVGGIVFIVTRGNSNKYTSPEKYEEKLEKDEKAILKNVKYEFITDFVPSRYSTDKEFFFSLVSTNKKLVDVAIPIKFYNSENVQVGSSTMYFFCAENDVKLYTSVDSGAPDVTYKIEEDKVEAHYSTDDECVSYKNKVNGKVNKVSEGNYEVVLTNGTSKDVSVRGLVLFYKNNKIIQEDYVSVSSLDANGTAKDDIHGPRDENYDYVTPDRVEFYLSRVALSE